MFIIHALFLYGMDIQRLKRYKDKISLAAKRIEEIGEWHRGFFEQEKDKLACYKAFQEAVEASLDMVAMMVKDSSQIPKDDYTNTDMLKNLNVITSATAGILAEANGLRNRVVHEYNGLQDRRAYTAILGLLPALETFLGEVGQWLKRK